MPATENHGFIFRYTLKQTVTNHALAQTFELLAEKGISEFYNGQLAKEIVKAVQVCLLMIMIIDNYFTTILQKYEYSENVC